MEEERDIEQRIAFHVAARNSSEALAIANSSLKLGVSELAINVLRRLQLRDGAKAKVFGELVVDRLLVETFTKNNAPSELASMLLRQFDERNGVFGIASRLPTKPLDISTEKVEKLAIKWLDFALTESDDSIGNKFAELRHVLLQTIPFRAKEIEAKFLAIKKVKNVDHVQLRENMIDKDVSAESIAQTALKKHDGERFHIYRIAFHKAANTSKEALYKLRASLESHPDGEDKIWVMDEIAANLSGKTAEDGDIDAARELARDVRSRDRRIGLLSFIALEYANAGNLTKARELVLEINLLLDLKSKDRMPTAIVGYQIFPTVFRTFAIIDPPLALNMLEALLPEFGHGFVKGFQMSNVDSRINVENLLERNMIYAANYSVPHHKDRGGGF